MSRPALLLAAAFAILGGHGHPAAADEAAYRHLVERATRLLKEAEGLHTAGRAANGRERARRAAALLAQADLVKAGDPNVAFLSVQAAVFEGDASSARRWIQRYKQRSPYGDGDPNLHYARALVWLRLDGRPAHAVESLDRMAAVSRRGLTRPATVLLYEALTAYARGLVDAGHPDEAVRQFRRASEVGRKLGDAAKEIAARANGAITLVEWGRAKDAEPLLARLHAQQAANPVFAYYLGRCRRLLDQPEKALAPLEQAAAALDGGRVARGHVDLVRRAWLELGIARRAAALAADDAARRRTLLDEARLALERFTVKAPRSAEGWHRLGRLLAEDLGRPLEAVMPLEKAHTLDPVCDQALQLLLRIAGREGPPEGESVDAWRERRRAWEQELAENADRWKAERARRREASRTGDDGCP